MKKSNTPNGFTLIELLLYVGIASSILLVSTIFLQTLLESRVKNQTMAEVEQQGLQVMQIMTQTIRNAENITLPTIGTNDTSLILDVVNVADDPTVFDLAGDTIQITEGDSKKPVSLVNSRVIASSLRFQNLSRKETPGVIAISFVLTHVNPEGRQEYDFSKTFYASASLRQP